MLIFLLTRVLTHVWKFHWNKNKRKSHGKKFMNLNVIWKGREKFSCNLSPTQTLSRYCLGNRCCECQMELKAHNTIFLSLNVVKWLICGNMGFNVKKSHREMSCVKIVIDPLLLSIIIFLLCMMSIQHYGREIFSHFYAWYVALKDVHGRWGRKCWENILRKFC